MKCFPIHHHQMKVSFTTPFFGIQLWILLLACGVLLPVALIIVASVIMWFCFIYYPRKKSYQKPRFSLPKSIACNHHKADFSFSSLDKRLLLSSGNNVSEHVINFDKLPSNVPCHFYPLVNNGINITKDGYLKGLESSGEVCSFANDMSKKCSFSLKEIEDATNGFAKENVIGSGDNGIVYLGLLPNNRQVAVKRLTCDCRHPKEFFAIQMEANARVKHNKLVKLLGYCAEGAYRILVSEYVANESLHHWLHEFPVLISPLTWDKRMNIINGVAKGLAHLHEGVKPKILHGSIKSSNILLDHHWNPKISDFGLIKVLSPEWSNFVMGTMGYMVPNCHSTEGNDIYDFGLLIMEIVSGRVPTYKNQPQAHIVDWFKSMISNGKIDHVVDSKLLEMPSSKELKHVALVALRCVDSDVNPRLKMRDVVRMLETNIILYEERHIAMKHFEQK